MSKFDFKERLHRARERLPLRTLMDQHGLKVPPGQNFVRCPFCAEKGCASFFDSDHGDELFKCHHTSCPTGGKAMDEIGFLVRHLHSNPKEAPVQYLKMAGLWEDREQSPSILPGKTGRKRRVPEDKPPSPGVKDQVAVAKVDDATGVAEPVPDPVKPGPAAAPAVENPVESTPAPAPLKTGGDAGADPEEAGGADESDDEGETRAEVLAEARKVLEEYFVGTVLDEFDQEQCWVKRIKGRKRHLLVDTLGLILGVEITPASTPERDGAQTLLTRVLGWFTWLRLMWVDGGYSGETFAQWVQGIRPKLKVEVVKRSDDVQGFAVLPRRWVVERTFGWLMRQRRLVRDYETSETSAQAWIYIAMIRIQLRRLA